MDNGRGISYDRNVIRMEDIAKAVLAVTRVSGVEVVPTVSIRCDRLRGSVMPLFCLPVFVDVLYW